VGDGVAGEGEHDALGPARGQLGDRVEDPHRPATPR
jgi:hypothetical protein